MLWREWGNGLGFTFGDYTGTTIRIHPHPLLSTREKLRNVSLGNVQSSSHMLSNEALANPSPRIACMLKLVHPNPTHTPETISRDTTQWLQCRWPSALSSLVENLLHLEPYPKPEP